MADLAELSIFEFYEKFELDDAFDHESYLAKNPKLAGFYLGPARRKGLSDKHRLYFHYMVYGDGSDSAHLLKPEAPTKETMYLKVNLGLCNRLLLLKSAVHFCKDNNHNLKVCWESTKGFDNTRFDELFKLEPFRGVFELIDSNEYDDAAKKHFSLESKFWQNPETFEYHFSSHVNEILLSLKTKTFCYSGWASIDWIFKDIHYLSNEFFDKLELHPDIQARVNRLTKEFGDRCIGLHLRAGDSANASYGFRYRGSLSQFMRAIESYPGDYKFFLSTDSQQAEEVLTAKYPGRIITQTKRFTEQTLTVHDPKPFQKAAAVDLFALGATKEVIGTSTSTFTTVASILSKAKKKFAFEFKATKKDLPPLSLVVALKDRFEMLRVSLNSWIPRTEFKEINVINWSSTDGFDHEYLKNLDPRIKVIDVKGKEGYHISAALNTAMNSASADYILKLDVDHILNPYVPIGDWLDINWDLEFIAGYWRQRAADNRLGFIEHLNGLFAISKANFKKSGGYDESMEGYGWEDCDMYQRLIHDHGLIRRYLPIMPNYVPAFHTPHSDASRMRHHKNKDREKSIQNNRDISRFKES